MSHKYKLGDLVFVKGVTGNQTIVDLLPYQGFQAYPIYLLEHIDDSTRNFYSEDSVELVLPQQQVLQESEEISLYGWGYSKDKRVVPCTCGAKYSRSNPRGHSDWCDRYGRDDTC